MMKFLPFSLLFCLSAARAWANEPVHPTPASTAAITYTAETFTTFDGLTLSGHLATPAGQTGPFPAVLLLVGSGPGDRYEDVPAAATADAQPTLLFRDIEVKLVAAGLAVFAYDKRGVVPHADFFGCDVTAAFQTATADNLAKDALSAFDHLAGLAPIQADRIVVLGHSEGTALALKIAEARPSVHSLLALGLWTRPFAAIDYYQAVTNLMRIFYLVDADNDGEITAEEYAPFEAESFSAWAATLQVVDETGDGRISDQEWRHHAEAEEAQFQDLIASDTLPWPAQLTIPRLWFRQYNAEGSNLPRALPLCAKLHVFHGEADVQTPFEDALTLKEACAAAQTPLASFHSYPGLGHAFSPRTGLRGWRDTIGPMAAQTSSDVAAQAAESLR